MSVARLRHVAQINPLTPEFDLLADDEPVTFLPLEAVWPGASLDVSRTSPKHEVDTGYTRFREGDILVPKITPTFEADRSTIARGLRQGIGTGTTELHIMRPGPDLDARYANYLVSSRPFLQGGEAAMKGVAGQQRVPEEWLRNFHVPVTDRTWQRAIADFLDAETTRIDAIITKKRHLRQLLREQFTSRIERVVWSGVRGTIPLMHLTPSDRQVMYGIVLPGPDVEEGVSIIKGGNVASGKLEPHQLARTTREIEASYARSRIAGGDVLYAIRGGIGDVAIAPASITGANITQDVARVAPRADVDSRWIRYALESATTRADALGRVVGATVRGINIWDLKRVQVPDVDSAEMRARADELSEIERSVNEIRQRLDRQTQLLSEHRQALITAAVTGRIEVPGS